MSFTVKIRTESGQRVMNDEVYDDLSKALTEANINMTAPIPIVVTVTGDDGVEYYSNRSE